MIDNLCPFPSSLSSTSFGSVAGVMRIGPTLQEIFAAAGDASAIGLVLSQMKRSENSPLLWVQDRKAIREMGRVFLHGLPEGLGRDIVHVAAKDGREALWAMAEGLKCSTLGAVIGEIHGDPRALDFTATRRLAVAAERYGVPAFLLRMKGQADLSGARRRWLVESRSSLPHPYDDKAPGAPVWSINLFRARDMQPGRWEASYDRTTHRLDMVSHLRDGSLDQDERRTG